MRDHHPGLVPRRPATCDDLGVEDEEREDTPDTVDLVGDLAQGGPVLVLAAGTGRVALRLLEAGLRVDAVEPSPDRADRLRARAGDEIDVTTGPVADVPVPARYRVVLLAGDALARLPTQDEQVRCFANVARHLGEGGLFVVETSVPTVRRGQRTEGFVGAETSADDVWLDAARHDPVAQVLTENQVRFTRAGIRISTVRTRYTWPSELDLMARLAGLRRTGRWAGWRREPFTAESRTSVALYAAVAGAAG